MTKITEALDRIARQCSVKAPSAWLSATRTDHVEIRDDFFLETVEDILDRVDLGEPIAKTQTITGGGGTYTLNADGSGNYGLNSNFRRMQRDEWAVYDNAQDRVGIPVTDSGKWTYLTDLGTAGIDRYFRVKGYEGNYTLDLYRDPGSGITINVHYIADVWMVSSGGTEGNQFTDSEDVLLLPRRLVEAGTVYRFRRRRGLFYEDKWKEYEALLSRAQTDSRQLHKVQFGEADRTVKWQDLVPAYIPGS